MLHPMASWPHPLHFLGARVWDRDKQWELHCCQTRIHCVFLLAVFFLEAVYLQSVGGWWWYGQYRASPQQATAYCQQTQHVGGSQSCRDKSERDHCWLKFNQSEGCTQHLNRKWNPWNVIHGYHRMCVTYNFKLEGDHR